MKSEKEYSDLDMMIISLFIVVLCNVTFFLCFHNAIFSFSNLSQETADDICVELTNNSYAVADNGVAGKLTCILSSYDSTQNIIIKVNNEEN